MLEGVYKVVASGLSNYAHARSRVLSAFFIILFLNFQKNRNMLIPTASITFAALTISNFASSAPVRTSVGSSDYADLKILLDLINIATEKGGKEKGDEVSHHTDPDLIEARMKLPSLKGINENEDQVSISQPIPSCVECFIFSMKSQVRQDRSVAPAERQEAKKDQALERQVVVEDLARMEFGSI